jgi:hypothetical protein
MKILHDIPISLTPEYVLQEQHRRRQKSVNSALVPVAKEAVAMAESLLAPAAIYDEFLVRDVTGEQVILGTFSPNGSTLAEGGKLTVGPKVDLLAPAKRVIVAVYTIGPALERRVHELQSAGETLLAYMLDTVGVLALGTVGEALRSRVESRASELGWRVSPALSPGSLVGWPLNGQRELCALLPLERISVHLNSYYVLEPHKSVSMAIGLGSDYESNHVGSVCRYCSLASSCWRRREERA